MTTDAYFPPAALGNAYAQNSGGAAEVTESMLNDLSTMRPWIVFLSVMAFVGAALMVFVGLAMVTLGSRFHDIAGAGGAPSAMGAAPR